MSDDNAPDLLREALDTAEGVLSNLESSLDHSTVDWAEVVTALKRVRQARAVLATPSSEPSERDATCPTCGTRFNPDDFRFYTVYRDAPSSEPSDPLALFVNGSATEMLYRMRHGAAKFGEQSWREQRYADEQVRENLDRAVEHLFYALRQTDDPAEWQKRAADVANQAFMAADPCHAYLLAFSIVHPVAKPVEND